MKKSYLFGISVIRVHEKKMLTYNDFLNLLKKKSYDEVVSELIKQGILKEGVFPEAYLTERENQLPHKLAELGIDIPSLFFLENDFFNIEATAKAVHRSTNPTPLLKKLSTVESRSLYKQDGFKSSYEYKKIFEETIKLLQNGENCEDYIKTKLFETGSKKSRSEYFKEWFRLIYELKTHDVKNENIKMDYLKNHKHDNFSIAPVFGYFYGTLTEIRNIRTVLTGKKNGADETEIEERLCKTYV